MAIPNGENCFTRLGFGLNVAPQIMRSIVKAVIGQDKTVDCATSSYVDDIFVNESVCSVAQVKMHLELFGLTCEDPEQLSSGAQVCWAYTFGRSMVNLDGNAMASVRRFLMYLCVVPSFLCMGG